MMWESIAALVPLFHVYLIGLGKSGIGPCVVAAVMAPVESGPGQGVMAVVCIWF